MIVYLPVGNGPLRRAAVELGHGMIVSRPGFRIPKIDCPWIFDNGAFDAWKHGYAWDGVAYLRDLSRVLALPPCLRPEWSVAPDRVADPSSLGFSVAWRKLLPNDLRWYLAVQDGMSEAAVDGALSRIRFDGIFVGGSQEWKGQTSAAWCRFARARKLPVHIGRINGRRRLKWALTIGAQSIDGTGWSRRPDWLDFLRDLRQSGESSNPGGWQELYRANGGDPEAASARKEAEQGRLWAVGGRS